MATITVPTDDRLITGMGDFVKRHVGAHTHVRRGYVNRVSRPSGSEYVLITPMTQIGTATNHHVYDPAAATVAVNRSTQRAVQIDCYGRMAEAWAKTLCILLRDEIAVSFFSPYGFAPLFTSDARDMTMDDGKGGYVARWMIECMTHGTEAVTTDQDFFDAVRLDLYRV